MLTPAAPRRRLDLAAVRALRASWGRTVLLFLTDRCPVGCAHCSVDSRPDGPSITDWARFEAILDGVAAAPGVRCVGISGGEPFVERRGLERAVAALTGAGKDVVVYTSGVWAHPAPAPWVTRVLARSAAVFLSSDDFHRAGVSRAQFVSAARAVVDAGAALVVPVLDVPAEIDAAGGLLADALGARWPAQAELMRNPPLAYGRGREVIGLGAARSVAELPPCTLARAPVIRYDGRATACCNEEVIRGGGPPRLAASIARAADVARVLTEFAADPLHRVIGTVAPATAVETPPYQALGAARYRSVCELCWAMHGRRAAAAEDSPVLKLLARVATLADGAPC